MAFAYTTRRGKTYYLHTGPKRGGGIQHYVSTDPKGSVADAIPEGCEIYETPNGQVYLRRKKPVRIQPPNWRWSRMSCKGARRANTAIWLRSATKRSSSCHSARRRNCRI